MEKWSDYEKYLKGEHLNGRRVGATIAQVVEEITHPNGQAERTPVLYFQGKQRGLILTPFNRNALRDMFGDNIANCIGKAVQLEAVPMLVVGKHTLPVRIFPAPQPTTSAAPATESQPAAGDAV